ncbi:YcdB/YcdC domain-containing protein [Lysinibacillus sp. NPDC097287]|uniref:YcdB/YcdC domain-containing protein n=1 Tax=Lysinibacillus sp. NPDC097287 TaxID=3364144 RepID=UPI00380A231E
MGNFKKLGIILTSTAFSLGVLSPVAHASASLNNEPAGKIEIQVASKETKVTKEELIKKLRTLFPNEFNFLTDKDFQIESGHYYPEDKTIRYELNFDKVVDGKNIYGNFSFRGDSLELESFHYRPADKTGALFPAKYSKDEAQKIAQDFLKKFTNASNYQLQEDNFGYDYYMSIPLSEPTTYSFEYQPTQNGVPISDQSIVISVLGNGVVDSMYRGLYPTGKATFDGLEQKKSETDIQKQIRDHLAVELRYFIDYNYATDEREVKLVYMPVSSFYGVHALTGQWQTLNGFSTQAPKAQAIEKLTTQPLTPRKGNLTLEEAEALAKSFLKVDSDKAKLTIDMVNERENGIGETIYTVDYSYTYGNIGTGSSLDINKTTGEIIQFYDLRNEFIKTNEFAAAITKEAALTKAIDYLKEWAPSYVHQYAKTMESYSFDEYSKYHQFIFPRVVNGITVTGDEINIGIGTDGSLRILTINHQNIQDWPSASKLITPEVAKETFSEALKTKLHYVKQANEDKQHYDLVYGPTYDGVLFNQLDATTGKWLKSIKPESNTPLISHPTAADELNYLLHQKVLEVKDPANFNADKVVTKGEAIKIIIKSMTYNYYNYDMSQEEEKQSFPNIDSKHPLYSIVEQAVGMGILEPTDNFKVEDALTRQELAEWFIRALQLEEAAQYNDIYKLDFKDASTIQPPYAGYVALVNAMGLLEAQENNFNATGKVTYAELAVSTIRLAHKIYEKEVNRFY